MKIVLILGIVILVIVILCLLAYLVSIRKTDKRQRNKNIMFSGGYPVDSYMERAQGGGLIYGEWSDSDTIVEGYKSNLSAYKQVKLVFTNCNTGQITQKNIGEYMEVVRGDDTDDNRVFGIKSRNVSKRHCCFTVRNGMVFLRDLGSTNHTYINRRQVTKETVVKTGDIISFGSETYELRIT